MLIYLLARIPSSRRISVTAPERLAVGLVDRRRRGVAVVSLRTPWAVPVRSRSPRARWRLDAYGDGAAAAGAELGALLSGWRALRDAGGGWPVLTAAGSGPSLRVRFGWPTGDS
jgi:hypothetical protein